MHWLMQPWLLERPSQHESVMTRWCVGMAPQFPSRQYRPRDAGRPQPPTLPHRALLNRSDTQRDAKPPQQIGADGPEEPKRLKSREMARHAEDRAITEAVIAMGKTLSLTIVAEGVHPRESGVRDGITCDWSRLLGPVPVAQPVRLIHRVFP